MKNAEALVCPMQVLKENYFELPHLKKKKNNLKRLLLTSIRKHVEQNNFVKCTYETVAITCLWSWCGVLSTNLHVLPACDQDKRHFLGGGS